MANGAKSVRVAKVKYAKTKKRETIKAPDNSISSRIPKVNLDGISLKEEPKNT